MNTCIMIVLVCLAEVGKATYAVKLQSLGGCVDGAPVLCQLAHASPRYTTPYEVLL